MRVTRTSSRLDEQGWIEVSKFVLLRPHLFDLVAAEVAHKESLIPLEGNHRHEFCQSDRIDDSLQVEFCVESSFCSLVSVVSFNSFGVE